MTYISKYFDFIKYKKNQLLLMNQALIGLLKDNINLLLKHIFNKFGLSNINDLPDRENFKHSNLNKINILIEWDLHL